MLSHGTLLPESGQNRSRRWDLTLLHLHSTDHDARKTTSDTTTAGGCSIPASATQTSDATVTSGSSTSAITASRRVEEIIKEQAYGG